MPEGSFSPGSKWTGIVWAMSYRCAERFKIGCGDMGPISCICRRCSKEVNAQLVQICLDVLVCAPMMAHSAR